MHSLLPTSTLSQHLSRCVHLFHYSSKYTSRLQPFSCSESSFPAEYDGLLGIQCISAFASVISAYVQYYGKIQLCLWAFLVVPCQKTAGPGSSHQDLNQKGRFSLHQNSCFFPFFSLEMASLASHSAGQVQSRNNAKRCLSLLYNDLDAFLFLIVLPLWHTTIFLTQKHINADLYLLWKIQQYSSI